ncbi:endonuclease/exonuclease/phosphatase family protein [Actinomadura sp. KC06]|uniref:endonuclease/exonuclease/phosphatase family protein n=1 Tax=Actinomadura sp. KC06 TaxID=2530369 RepID=UPI001050D983|nr:endonuclease/exonuclease/phosphatase family protein [Actinomadura sp. KC06]TDD13898.1 endonuclease/exonuclease/phosphatase family protein [Actinomadura sp. KC06]
MGELVTVMSLNTRYGGREDGERRVDDRLGPQADLIAQVRPDVLLLQELTDWGRDPRWQGAAERELERRGWGLRFLVAPSRVDNHTAVAFRPERLAFRHFETKYGHLAEFGYGMAVLADRDAPEDAPGLTVISAHLTPYSAQAAAVEAQRMSARLQRYGARGILGGDINHMPLGDPEPDWDAVEPYNRSSRCLPRSSPDEPWRGNRIVGEVLGAALVDVAAHLAEKTGRPELRAPTATGGLRVDQFHITPNLLDALEGYERLPAASDHDAIVMRLDMMRAGPGRAWV